MHSRSKRTVEPRGFSLVEALVALSLVTIAGVALLARFGDQGRFVADSLDETVAEGMALQLMNEIAACKFVTAGQTPNSTVGFGPSTTEAAGPGRSRYDDIDDFHGFTASPPVDLYGVPLGTEDVGNATRHPSHKVPATSLIGWRQSVGVYFVSDANPSQRLAAGAASFHKEVEVVISYADPREGTVELARLSRVFAYVPPP
jgi:type II secretory pathway pseudopilin PulG